MIQIPDSRRGWLDARRATRSPRFRRADLIFNPIARRMQRGQTRKLREVISNLTAEGLEVSARPTRGPEHASQLARESVQSNTDLVIVCGGDGTVNEVASGLGGSAVPMMVLPFGTANVLAREIGLPRDLAACASLVRKGFVRRVSLGQAGQRPFLLMAGIGVDAGVVAASSRWVKRLTGEGAYWLAGFKQLGAYGFWPFDLIVDGTPYRGTFAVVSKARNYAGSFQLTPDGNLFSHRFEICLFQSESRWRYLRYLAEVALGRHQRLPDVLMLHGHTVEAVGSPEVKVQVDGELLGGLPQKFTLAEDALSLVVPPGRSSDFPTA